MNLNMIRPKNEIESLLLSITKNCETLINQTHTKPQETIEFKMTKPRETFHFTPPMEIKEDWMLGLVDLRFIILFLIKQKKITNLRSIEIWLTNLDF